MLNLGSTHIWRSKDYPHPYSVTIKKIENGLIYTDSVYEEKKTEKIRPPWALLSCIAFETRHKDSWEKNIVKSGNLEEIALLEQGHLCQGVVHEQRSDGVAFDWQYLLKVEETYNTHVLNQNVLAHVIFEKREMSHYWSEMKLHYAPTLHAITHYEYRDSWNKNEVSYLAAVAIDNKLNIF